VADATVTQGRREESLPISEEPAPTVGTRVRAVVPRPLLLLWAGIVVAIIVFLVFGTVRIAAGDWIGLRLPVRRIWARFTTYLVEEGATGAMVVGVTAVALLALLGSAVVLWLAFALRDHPDDQIPGDPRER
jgi:hypothetical protein